MLDLYVSLSPSPSLRFVQKPNFLFFFNFHHSIFSVILISFLESIHKASPLRCSLLCFASLSLLNVFDVIALSREVEGVVDRNSWSRRDVFLAGGDLWRQGSFSLPDLVWIAEVKGCSGFRGLSRSIWSLSRVDFTRLSKSLSPPILGWENQSVESVLSFWVFRYRA